MIYKVNKFCNIGMKNLIKLCKEKWNILRKKINNKQTNHNSPIILTDDNFTESVNKFQILIVDFWAAWCGPCKMISPLIKQLSSELAGKAIFGKLNVDDNPSISNAFGIQSIPTIIIFKNGQVDDRIIGAMTKSQLILKISTHIER